MITISVPEDHDITISSPDRSTSAQTLAATTPPPRHRRQLDHLPNDDDLFQSFLANLYATNRVFVPPPGYGGVPLVHHSQRPSSSSPPEELVTLDASGLTTTPSIPNVPVTAFIGLRRGNLRRSYVQSGLAFESAPCTLNILETIFACDCIPGRIISKWPQGEIFIGTSRHPIDIESDDYQHHSTQFHEIGRLHDVLDMELPRADFDVALQPAVESNCRTQLMVTHGLNSAVQIYVLYIWEEVSSTSYSLTDSLNKPNRMLGMSSLTPVALLLCSLCRLDPMSLLLCQPPPNHISTNISLHKSYFCKT